MEQEAKSEKEKAANLLEMTPVRAVSWETDSHDRIVLLKPKFNWPWLKKHFLPRMKRPHYRIQLDDKGSFIWRHCNGKNTVGELAEMHTGKFGEDVEPLLERLALFLYSLEKNGFIEFGK